ncbi:hypothetical protein JTE90_009787 [Oedothorax gibbosus]|uniref:Uncharacterized protein n=1 Tax=Oedothorax gibbosus TaxID=931172 RepID=A0AAV6TG64_9ARAC|nr:hypothetical protein JTE90_009787 [Oedothorax gibbosus]
MTRRAASGNQSFWVPGEVWLQSGKLKGIEVGSPPFKGALRFKFDSTQQTLPGQDTARIDRLRVFSDFVGMVHGALGRVFRICLVYSDNGRGSSY